MAAIESTEDILDKMRLMISKDITAVNKLKLLFSELDPQGSQPVFKEDFLSMLSKCTLFLSKHDASNITRKYKIDELHINHTAFIHDFAPPLDDERTALVKQLFGLLAAPTESAADAVVYYKDIMSHFDPRNHPAVRTGQRSERYVVDSIQAALKGISECESEPVGWAAFLRYFRGISVAFYFNSDAFGEFVRCSWHSLFESGAGRGDGQPDSVQQVDASYMAQIEALLAEKARQKVRGSENESQTLLRTFKHFDLANCGSVNVVEFRKTFESFGVFLPDKELQMLFEQQDKDKDGRVLYRGFVESIFRKH